MKTQHVNFVDANYNFEMKVFKDIDDQNELAKRLKNILPPLITSQATKKNGRLLSKQKYSNELTSQLKITQISICA